MFKIQVSSELPPAFALIPFSKHHIIIKNMEQENKQIKRNRSEFDDYPDEIHGHIAI